MRGTFFVPQNNRIWKTFRTKTSKEQQSQAVEWPIHIDCFRYGNIWVSLVQSKHVLASPKEIRYEFEHSHFVSIVNATITKLYNQRWKKPQMHKRTNSSSSVNLYYLLRNNWSLWIKSQELKRGTHIPFRAKLRLVQGWRSSLEHMEVFHWF